MMMDEAMLVGRIAMADELLLERLCKEELLEETMATRGADEERDELEATEDALRRDDESERLELLEEERVA